MHFELVACFWTDELNTTHQRFQCWLQGRGPEEASSWRVAQTVVVVSGRDALSSLRGLWRLLALDTLTTLGLSRSRSTIWSPLYCAPWIIYLRPGFDLPLTVCRDNSSTLNREVVLHLFPFHALPQLLFLPFNYTHMPLFAFRRCCRALLIHNKALYTGEQVTNG